jgi:hypothetical protein
MNISGGVVHVGYYLNWINMFDILRPLICKTVAYILLLSSPMCTYFASLYLCFPTNKNKLVEL